MEHESRQVLRQYVEDTAAAFIQGREGEANESFVGLIDKLVPLLQSAEPEVLQQLNKVLTETLAAQGRKDYLHIADQLQYELAPLLDSMP